jgi:hypothetical protein
MLGTDDHAQNETSRKLALFAWALLVLEEAGLISRITAAANLRELDGITFDPEALEIVLAIRDALHPAGETKPAEYFAGLREGALKQILKGRFDEAKRDRARELSPGGPTAAQYEINAADLVHRMVTKYVELTQQQAVAVTMWILHTHLLEHFSISPRLALISPVRGCGKTTLLDICERLAARGLRTDSITAAAISRLVDAEQTTLLADEADNLDFAADKLLKAVLHGGHRRGARRIVVSQGQPTKLSIFAPMAFASIGMLTMPLMHRSVTIEMSRATRPLARFDANDLEMVRDFTIVFREISQWAQGTTPTRDPPLPKMLRNRPADNWRVLIAVADSCSKEWGGLARDAAVALTKTRPDEDPTIILLTDIRNIFDQQKVDRLSSHMLTEELIAIEDGLWNDWRGIRDDRQPRRLSQGELARLLAPFKIRPRTVWPRGSRASRGKSSRGYFREQFVEAWRTYCSSDTPTHGGKPSGGKPKTLK